MSECKISSKITVDTSTAHDRLNSVSNDADRMNWRMKMQKAFQTWTKRWEDGTTSRFLAIPNDSHFVILDDEGHIFGSWLSIESFKTHQKRHEAESLIGRVKLQHVVLPAI